MMTDILEILENGRVDWSDEHQTTTTIVTKNERLAIAEIKKLRARIAELEKAQAKDAEEEYVRRIKDARIAELEAANAELRVLLKDCADDLEAEVDERYGETSKKCMPHRYERDMAPVVAARAALNGEKE